MTEEMTAEEFYSLGVEHGLMAARIMCKTAESAFSPGGRGISAVGSTLEEMSARAHTQVRHPADIPKLFDDAAEMIRREIPK